MHIATWVLAYLTLSVAGSLGIGKLFALGSAPEPEAEPLPIPVPVPATALLRR
jgi:hypothetical protein